MSGFTLGKLKLDASEYGSQGGAVLGIRDSGKTYTATLLAERLFDAGVPFTAFDPIGVWRFLRVPGNGRGYPVVVAGGVAGDLPLSPASAPAIVEAAMASGISLVIDLFSIELSKADWRRIVRDSVRTMLHKNSQHGLRHVFIEEAAEFCPQRVTDGDVYAEIEKLARMGGNSRLGYTLINQRAEEVNKAVLELCDNLFLHRQKGKNSLNSLTKWLDVADAKNAREIIASLPTLPQGECWAWLGGTDTPVHLKVPPKNSFHPDRRTMRGETEQAAKKAVDVGSFVTALKDTLPKIEEEATANDPKKLRARIAELERAAPGASKAELNAAYQRGLGEGETVGYRKGWAAAQEAMRPLVIEVNNAIGALASLGGAPLHMPHPTATLVSISPKRPTFKANGHALAAALPIGERAVLRAAAQYPEGVGRDQLSVLIGYKRSSRDAYIARLKEKGFVETPGSSVVATPKGITALGSDYEPLPTGVALQEYWLARLPEGERKILSELLTAYPRAVDRERLDDATGYKRSSRDAYLSRLAARRLVASVERGQVRASETLFS